MSKRRGPNKTVGNGLGDVGAAVDSLAPHVPSVEVPDFGSNTPEEMDKLEEEILKQLPKVGDGCLAALRFLDETEGRSREVNELPQIQAKVQQAEDHIASLTGHRIPAFRRAACTAVFSHYLDGHQPDQVTPGVLEMIAARLMARDVLVEDDGPIRILDRTFAISDSTAFGDQEKAEIVEKLRGLTRMVRQAMRTTFRDEARVLPENDTMSVEQFLGGEEGIVTLGVPKQLNGDDRFHRSGTVSLEVRGDRIWALGATGTIVDLVNVVRSANGGTGLFVLRSSLQENRHPFVRLPEALIRIFINFWWLLKRAIASAEIYVKHEALKVDPRVDITDEQFFLGRRDTGTAFVSFKDVWEIPQPGDDPKKMPLWRAPDGRLLPHIFFLVERGRSEDEETRLRIVEIPEHLDVFLGNCLEEYPDDFKRLPQPLSALLGAIYGQVANKAKRAARIAKKQTKIDEPE